MIDEEGFFGLSLNDEYFNGLENEDDSKENKETKNEGFFERTSTKSTSFLDSNSDEDDDKDNDDEDMDESEYNPTQYEGSNFIGITPFDTIRRNLNTESGYNNDDDDDGLDLCDDMDDNDEDFIGEISHKRIKHYDDLIRDNLITLFPQKSFESNISPQKQINFGQLGSPEYKDEKCDKPVYSKYLPRRVPLKESVLTSLTQTVPAQASKYKTFGVGFSHLRNHVYVAMTPQIIKTRLYGESDPDEIVYTDEIMKRYISLFAESANPTQNNFFTNFSTLYGGNNKYKFIFKLLEILTFTARVEDSEVEKYVRFGSWLKEFLSFKNETKVQTLIKSAKYEEACFLYLCGGQVEKAVSMAVLSSSPYLATIISALPHDHVRSLLYHQLEEWHESVANGSGPLSPSLERIYLLLSGKFQRAKSEYWNEVDWITCLGAYYWYGDNCDNDLAKFLNRLCELTETKQSVPKPLPSLYSFSNKDSKKAPTDTLYAMMATFGAKMNGRNVRDMMNPEGYSALGKNNVVSWVLIKYVGEVSCNSKDVADVAGTVRSKVLHSLVDQLARYDMFSYRAFIIENEHLPKSLLKCEKGCLCEERDKKITNYVQDMKRVKNLLLTEKSYLKGFEEALNRIIIPNIINRNRNYNEIYNLFESVFVGETGDAATARSQTSKSCPQPNMFLDYIKCVELGNDPQKISKESVRRLLVVADALLSWSSKGVIVESERIAIEIMSENVASRMYDSIVGIKFGAELDDDNDVDMNDNDNDNDALVKELKDRINNLPISKPYKRMILLDLSVL